MQSHNYRAFSNFSPVTPQIRFSAFFPPISFYDYIPQTLESESLCLAVSIHLPSFLEANTLSKGEERKQWRKISGEERGTVALS